MNRPLVVIVGPSASGKSQLALRLATAFNAEIVSADSWSVRRHLDIGTSKPSKADLAKVPHHLIDIIDPDDDFTAVAFKAVAITAIKDIQQKGKLAILVGGSGLYIYSLVYDYSFAPRGSLTNRAKLNAMPLEDLQALALGQGLDLSTIDSRNKRRVIRMIETRGVTATKQELRPGTLIIGLAVDKTQLIDNITKRVDDMLARGLEDEVRSLSKKYGWECEGLKGIGYQEWKLYFDGQQSLPVTRERIIKDTLLLAKRQNTWFKANKSIHWFTTPVKYIDVEDLVTSFLNKNIP